ncbi:L,D-transpeptidase family protein [Salaquimonas pukyongi]|uniref:L,D-transpeptidase family protein n=1 Tax=Salaquimonas pukyongi TaxID=2712698 RepID=UPI0013BE965C|nr:L,D-transpeptidase family protein [Salaquimonas pukyongi]
MPAAALLLSSALVTAALATSALAAKQAAGKSGLKELTVRSGEDESQANAPVLVTVSIDNQQLRVYRGTDKLAASRVSSGKPGYDTPMGVFSILEKKRRHRSNIYSGAPMPYMQRLTWSGIALHQSNSVPSWPASHGCVRLPGKFAKQLFNLTERGAHVLIAREMLQPAPIRHKALFQPGAAEAKMASLRDTIDGIANGGLLEGLPVEKPEQTAEIPKPLRIYATRITRREITRELQRLLNRLGHEAGEVDGLYGKGTAEAVIRFQKAQGLAPTGMLSEELVDTVYSTAGEERPLPGMIYVRRGHLPVFSAPIGLRNPKEPLGTHFFLASGDKEQLNWLSVSMAGRIPPSVVRDHKLEVEGSGQLVRSNPRTALDRLIIDAKTRERIALMIGHGASFSVSDNGLGTETGWGTDFIVQLR